MCAAELYKFVTYASKCIGQIKPRNMCSPYLQLCILDDFLDNLDMLGASIYTLEEGVLVAGIYVSVAHHEVVKPLCFDMVIGLTEDSRQGKWPEIGWIL